MQTRPFTRIYTDNDHYDALKVADLENIPYMDSLFSVVWKYLYKDDYVSENDYGYLDFCMKSRIRPYDFMTLTFYIIGASTKVFGEATIEDYLETIGLRDNYKEERVVYSSENSLLVTNASTELKASVVWAAYIYANIRSELDGGKWKEIAPMLWGVLKKQLTLIEEAFNKLYIVRNTENALKTFVNHLLSIGGLSKSKGNNINDNSASLDNQNSKEIEVLRRRVKAIYPFLYSKEAEDCWQKLRDKGYVDEWNQPTNKLTNECRAVMGNCIAVKLGFKKNKWAVLESYWDCKHMAQDYKEGLDSNRIDKFDKEMEKLLELPQTPKPKIKL